MAPLLSLPIFRYGGICFGCTHCLAKSENAPNCDGQHRKGGGCSRAEFCFPERQATRQVNCRTLKFVQELGHNYIIVIPTSRCRLLGGCPSEYWWQYCPPQVSLGLMTYSITQTKIGYECPIYWCTSPSPTPTSSWEILYVADLYCSWNPLFGSRCILL